MGPVKAGHDPDGQRAWWDARYRDEPVLFGDAPSEAGARAALLFREDGARRVLELAAGHGRDTLHLAGEGFAVTALDYSDEAVRLLRHDVRTPLPCSDGAFDAARAQMLLCMDLSADELAAVVAEVRRVLRPGGTFVYTVRHAGDTHATAGTARPDGCREHGGFVVRSFDRALVDRLAEGFVLEAVEPFEEGALTRRLWCVTMRRPGEA